MSDVSDLVGPEILRQVRSIELRTKHLVSTILTGDYRSVFRGRGMEFAEVRAYDYGDDFRSIDWNVSARMGEPYVKLFNEERELTLFVILDRSGSSDFGSPTAKSRMGIEVAAVLALAAARQNDRVGAMIFSEGVDHLVPPGKGRRHALRVIRDLLSFEPARHGTNIAGAMAYASRLLRNRSVVVIISDFRDKGWEQQLRSLSSQHDVVAITVDDPREIEIPDVGWIEMVDAETDEKVLVDTSSRDARMRIRIGAEEQRQARRAALEYAGADQVALRTDRPYVQPLHDAFARRAARLKR